MNFEKKQIFNNRTFKIFLWGSTSSSVELWLATLLNSSQNNFFSLSISPYSLARSFSFHSSNSFLASMSLWWVSSASYKEKNNWIINSTLWQTFTEKLLGPLVHASRYGDPKNICPTVPTVWTWSGPSLIWSVMSLEDKDQVFSLHSSQCLA